MRSFLKKAVLICVLITGSISASILNAREVDMDLLLLIDSSGSIDEIESQLQFQGYADAFRNQDVINTILSGPNKSIAVNVLLFSNEVIRLIDWTVIDTPEAANDFASRIDEAPRFTGGTYICKAVRQAIIEFSNCPYQSKVLTIDISGDGPDNEFEMPPIPTNPLDFLNALLGSQTQQYGASKILNDTGLQEVRRILISSGINVNCLAIEDPMMKPYFENNIMCGPDAFTLFVSNFKVFSGSVHNKLLKEIKSGVSKSKEIKFSDKNKDQLSVASTNKVITTSVSDGGDKQALSISNKVSISENKDGLMSGIMSQKKSLRIILQDEENSFPIEGATLSDSNLNTKTFLEKGDFPGNYKLSMEVPCPPLTITINAPFYEQTSFQPDSLNPQCNIIKMQKRYSKIIW